MSRLMSTVPRTAPTASDPPVLESGDRMSRAEFHRIYEQMPEGFKAELIGGTVYVASPLKRLHGLAHAPLTTLLYLYKSHTPGTEMNDNVTVVLGQDSEPQPDGYLRILPEYGGQSRTTADDYIDGAPELIVEVALSSRSFDLHQKRADYTRHGVLEYLILSLKDQRFYWFDLRSNAELFAETDGVIRVRTFPGLWINVIALLQDDCQRIIATLNEGLASPEHAAFVSRLAEAHGKHTP